MSAAIAYGKLWKSTVYFRQGFPVCTHTCDHSLHMLLFLDNAFSQYSVAMFVSCTVTAKYFRDFPINICWHYVEASNNQFLFLLCYVSIFLLCIIQLLSTTILEWFSDPYNLLSQNISFGFAYLKDSKEKRE